jgi:hypothetical protein
LYEYDFYEYGFYEYDFYEYGFYEYGFFECGFYDRPSSPRSPVFLILLSVSATLLVRFARRKYDRKLLGLFNPVVLNYCADVVLLIFLAV